MSVDTLVTIKAATSDDLSDIVNLLADDEIASLREETSGHYLKNYRKAFEYITKDENNEVWVAVNHSEVLAVLQITFIPSLTYKGGWRAQIEGVRVREEYRSGGIGTKLISWAIRRAAERECKLVQLTTNKSRPQAIEFYRKLGFVSSHEGLKMIF